MIFEILTLLSALAAAVLGYNTRKALRDTEERLVWLITGVVRQEGPMAAQATAAAGQHRRHPGQALARPINI